MSVSAASRTMLTRLPRALARPAVARRFAAAAGATASLHSLPALPYAYEALEPYISKEIMTLHHTKHHQTYVNGLNTAEDAYAKASSTEDKIALQSALKFNGGGHINHSLFWKNLAPSSSGGGQLSDGPLKAALERDFGSVESFKKEVNAKGGSVQGSGWVWLGYNKSNSKFEVITTANQDPLLSHAPIIGIDVWEHAYYLQYKNVKPDYLNAIWNVINFKEAEQRFVAAAK